MEKDKKAKIAIRQATKQGYIECEIGGIADFSYPCSNTRRGRVQNGGGTCPTLTASAPDILVIEEGDKNMYSFVYEDDEYEYYVRLRKLTPRENWRLMGFSDEDFDKAASVNSNCQLYKQAGNSIVKNVLVGIIGQFFEGKEDIYKQISR